MSERMDRIREWARHSPSKKELPYLRAGAAVIAAIVLFACSCGSPKPEQPKVDAEQLSILWSTVDSATTADSSTDAMPSVVFAMALTDTDPDRRLVEYWARGGGHRSSNTPFIPGILVILFLMSSINRPSK